MIARLLENVRRRSAIRRAIVGLYDEGMCRHVHARVVPPFPVSDYADVRKWRVEYVHPCGETCAWLAARRIADEHLGAW